MNGSERVQRNIEKSLFMGGLIFYLRYMSWFACSGIQLISVCLFVLFFFVLCTLCCQFLWIIHLR